MNYLFNLDSGDSIYILPMLKAVHGAGYIYCRSSGGSQTPHVNKQQLYERLFYNQSYVHAFGFCNQDVERHSFFDQVFWEDKLVTLKVDEMHFSKNQFEKVYFGKTDSLVGHLNVRNCTEPRVDVIPNLYWNGSDPISYVFGLGELALRRFNLNTDIFLDRWLELPDKNSWERKDKLHDKRYTIARSQRHNPNAQIMKKIVETLGPENFCFIGLPHEHVDFCDRIAKVDTIETKDLYDVAIAIDDSEMFVGNQSCCLAIAESLKKPVIQETSRNVPNCTFSRIRKDFFLGFFEDGEVRLINNNYNEEEKDVDFYGLNLKRVEDPEENWANRHGRIYDVNSGANCVQSKAYYII